MVLDNSSGTAKPKIQLNCTNYAMNICNKMSIDPDFKEVYSHLSYFIGIGNIEQAMGFYLLC